jgi:hypothetical protein
VPLFGRWIAPGSDVGVPCARLCARVREPDLAGIAEGADARLAAELVMIQRFSPLPRTRR